MIFTRTDIPGAYIIDLEKIKDDRGYFARSYCVEEFAAAGISFQPVQTNISQNNKCGTLRGMHYQKPPYQESKLVRCTRGKIFDVAIDLREDSPAWKQWFGVELSCENNRSFYIPAGCAHGFLTLEDNTDISYLMGSRYVPGASEGVRWNDLAFGIKWPGQPMVLSDRDRNYPFYVA